MGLLQDVRFALRLMRRSPLYTLAGILVLALGIGANTAIFSIVDAVLLRPLPFPQPGQLVGMYETETAPGSYPLSGPDFPDWKAQARLFSGMTLYSYQQNFNLAGEGHPDRVRAVPVDANFFSVLGVPPLLGRTMVAGEDQPGHNHVVVLSYPLWQSRFASDRGILGRAVNLNGEPYIVIGVMGPEFRAQTGVQLWPAMDASSTGLGQRGNHSYSAIGRMRPGVTVAQAQAEIIGIAARLEKQYPDSNYRIGARVFSLTDLFVRRSSKDSLRTLMWVVGLLLLIACANLANLSLARALSRRKEISIRLALGAPRARIVRQLLTEAVMLAGAGAAVGVGLAWIVVRAVSQAKAYSLPRFNAVQIDPLVLGFTTALALVCGVAFGLAPALRLSRPDVNEELKGAGGGGASARRAWLGHGLVVAEIAVTLVLVTAAGLFLKSFVRLRSQSVGVKTAGVVTAAATLPANVYDTDAKQAALARRFLERARAIPGVQLAALTSELPLQGGSNGYIRLKEEANSRNCTSLVEWTEVSRDYFAVMGIPALQGSVLSDVDFAAWTTAQAVLNDPKATDAATNSMSLPVVVTASTARTYWPNQNPIGREFSRGSSSGPWLRVVGVVGDVNIFGLGTQNIGQAFFPISGRGVLHLAVRTALPTPALQSALQGAMNAIDSTIPLYSVLTMDEVVDQSASAQQFQSGLMASFAGLALLLAVAGIYGVTSYLVGQRTREIGIRMAMGARGIDVVGLVLGGGMRLTLAGLLLGILGALLAGRLLSSQLAGVSPHDWGTLAAATAVLCAASFLACYVPARRAAALDPNQALRLP